MSPRWKLLLGTLLLAAGAAWIFWPYVTSTAVILDLTGRGGAWRHVLPVRVRDVVTRDVSVPTRDGQLAARIYTPVGGSTRAVIVFPGIHTGGVDEPRLAALSHRLAATGLTVVSAPLPDLRAYRIIPHATDQLEDAAVWATSQRELAPSGRVSLIGVSFAGGLALVAAGRPSLSGKLDVVVSLGGQGDLPRALQYLCTGVLPDGSRRAPHDYGVVILLLAALQHFVPAAQVEPLHDAIVTFLDASGYESTDRARSARLFAEARAKAAGLPDPARTVMGWVNDRNVAALGPKLLPYLEELGGDPALSPERSPATQVPVFLLHGAADNVIPSTETPRVADYLGRHGNARVAYLLTPLLSHADTSASVRMADAWALVRFWTRMLAPPR
jgi:dienelactone hydrolase